MKIEEAYKKAYQLLLEEGFEGFYLIKELPDKWVFFGGNPEIRFYGLRTVYVDKKTGECHWFDINHRRSEMKEAKELRVPKEYEYKRAF